MTQNSFGPREWSEDFISSVASRKDNNHYQKVDEAMVDRWCKNLDAQAAAFGEKLSTAIKIANGN